MTIIIRKVLREWKIKARMHGNETKECELKENMEKEEENKKRERMVQDENLDYSLEM